MNEPLTYTSYFAFCGSGGGALGFKRAETHLLDRRLTFRVLGGFDVDPKACANFHYLTEVPALCADVRSLSVTDLIRSAQGVSPDVVFSSAPCVGASKLVTDEKAATDHYVQMNELALVWTRMMLEVWQPRFVIYENVPNIVHRAKGVVKEIHRLLKKAGYLFDDAVHELGEYGPPDAPGGFYDAGKLGGLAERRKRWLLEGRHPNRCSALLFKPLPRRVRGVGEVIGPLPMPEDPAGGPMHVLPRLSVMNWIRLALIPAGGDWRDLPGVLAQEQERREVFRRYHLARWSEAAVTVGGSGTNGPYGVADPRIEEAFKGAYGVTEWGEPSAAVTGESMPSNQRAAVADPRVVPQADNQGAFYNKCRVESWTSPSHAVTGSTRVGSGAPSVADPRLNCQPHAGAYGVTGWTDPASTITGSGQVDNGRQAVADPRAHGFRGVLGVVPWDASTGTVTGNARPQTGAFNVADPRVGYAFNKGYAVVDWNDPTNTIAGATSVGCGTYAVADPRTAPPGWLTVDDVMVMLETPGPWAIVDRTSDGPPLAVITDLQKPSPIPLRIVARDGTWHRPFTTYELAVIQGLPAVHAGAPLRLSGPATTDRKQIGNLVPPPAALVIAEQKLLAMGQHDMGAFSLSGAGGVWVDTVDAEGVVLQ